MSLVTYLNLKYIDILIYIYIENHIKQPLNQYINKSRTFKPCFLNLFLINFILLLFFFFFLSLSPYLAFWFGH